LDSGNSMLICESREKLTAKWTMPERGKCSYNAVWAARMGRSEIKVGDKYSDFEVMDNGFSPVKLSSYTGKIVVIVLALTLDIRVWDLENGPNYEAVLEAVNQYLTG